MNTRVTIASGLEPVAGDEQRRRDERDEKESGDSLDLTQHRRDVLDNADGDDLLGQGTPALFVTDIREASWVSLRLIAGVRLGLWLRSRGRSSDSVIGRLALPHHRQAAQSFG